MCHLIHKKVSNMTTVILREKSHELKEILGRAMELVAQMCDDSNEMGERGGYGNRYYDRDMMGERMGMRDYQEMPPYEMGERRGVKGTGRYSRY